MSSMVLPPRSPHLLRDLHGDVGSDDAGSLNIYKLVCLRVYPAGSVDTEFCPWRIRSVRAHDLYLN